MEILVGILAAWGAVMLVWTLLGFFLMPLTRRKTIKITAVVQAVGTPRYLEQYIRGLKWLRDMGLIWWNVAVVADQLEPETVQQTQRFLEKEASAVVIAAEDLLDWMER